MSPKAQRIAIAEASGWKKHEKFNRWKFCDEENLVCWASLPDYLNDLNAMREAEQWLFRQGITRNGRAFSRYETQDEYLRNLLIVCRCPRPELEATAPQRAKAFIKTMNLWNDDL